MNRLNGMRGSEAKLKVIVDRLAQVKDKGMSARYERAYLRMVLRARLVAMRSAIDILARGLTQTQHDELDWQVRMGLPLFSHLESILTFLDEGALEVPAVSAA